MTAQKMSGVGPAIGILRMTDCGATWQNFVVNPGSEGRIETILPTGIDLDPGGRVQEMVLVATIDRGAGIWRSNDNGPSPGCSLYCRSEQTPAFYAALPRDVSRDGNVVL
jgi:hypothetical protein